MGQNPRHRIKYVFINTSAKEEKEPPQEHQGEVHHLPPPEGDTEPLLEEAPSQ